MIPSINPLPPKEAIAYFRSKGLKPSFAWQDIWQQEHAKAFTVAKMMNRDLLETTRSAVDAAIANGTTFEQFKTELKPKLQAAGWWGRQKMTDPLTGEDKTVQLGSDRRLRVIFDTNLRTSYAVGNWQRAWKNRATFPYMRYQHNQDRFPRPQHVAWDGTVLPIDDPWWDTHYPPCAWGCKCSTVSFSQSMLDGRDLKVTPAPAKFPKRDYVNPRTGEVTSIEEGIQPGWNYNVGKAPLRGLSPSPAPQLGSEAPALPPQTQEKVTAFLKAFGAAPAGDQAAVGKIFIDSDQWPIAITDGMFKDAGGRLTVPRADLVDWLPAVANALKTYDHVSWVWSTKADGTAALVRRYIKRVTKPTPADIVIDIAGASWTYDVRPVSTS